MKETNFGLKYPKLWNDNLKFHVPVCANTTCTHDQRDERWIPVCSNTIRVKGTWKKIWSRSSNIYPLYTIPSTHPTPPHKTHRACNIFHTRSFNIHPHNTIPSAHPTSSHKTHRACNIFYTRPFNIHLLYTIPSTHSTPPHKTHRACNIFYTLKYLNLIHSFFTHNHICTLIHTYTHMHYNIQHNHKETIRIAQANLARCRDATDECLEKAYKEKVNILVLQEMYCCNGEPAGLGRFSNVILWCCRENETPWACICVLNRKLTATLVRQVSTSHCVVAHISGPTQQFYLVSLYCQFSKPIVHYAQQLTAALECVGSDRVIIGADVNGVSPIWSERATTSDSNGLCFEDVIQATNLVPLNRPGNLCTHISENRDIDITLASFRLFDKVTSWRVMEDWTLSDHRTIVFEIVKEECEAAPVGKMRFNINKARWKQYLASIDRMLDTQTTDTKDTQAGIDDTVSLITRTMVDAAEDCIPRKKRHKKSVPWGNEELSNLKREIYRQRRKYQHETQPEMREMLKNEYRNLRYRYKRKLYEARRKSWRDFVSKIGNKNVFGLVYRLANEKVMPATGMASLHTDHGFTRTERETNSTLLSALFGVEESAERLDDDYETVAVAEAWSLEEVKKAILSLKNKKAPGQDLIEYKESDKYLGVTIQSRFGMDAHVDAVAVKAKRLISRLKRLVGHDWELSGETLTGLYRMVFLPIMLYAIGAWGFALHTESICDKLNKHQRFALTAVTRAYCTKSTDALQVLSGSKPLDLEAKERYYKYKLRKRIPFISGVLNYTGHENQALIRKQLSDSILQEWQGRWSESSKGPVTKKFLPDVRKRMQLKWIALSHQTTQFLTGHKDLAAKLAGFHLVENPACTCGQEETSIDILYDCEEYQEEAQELRQVTEEGPSREEASISNKQRYAIFSRTCSRILVKKKNLRRNANQGDDDQE
ncbi:unnamed protein product [Trichogramma brassicae]|uniref:Endonuclease/exonuclease/phosphatase domain-containing protein n=1 Tax=Trichogramma brassicae TaxID=86971 RepID=A0A6H5IC38_9HYME|nr:unnamed protein product [Trichogramma brassicae]